MTDKLKPCPFCGGEAKLSINKTNQGQVSIVSCSECTCRKTLLKYPFYEGSIEQDAIEDWNTRKPMDRIVEKLEKVMEYREKSYKEWEGTTFGQICKTKAYTYEHAIKIVKAGGKDE